MLTVRRILDDPHMPRDFATLDERADDGAVIVAYAHPATALRLRHPGHPALSERTLGHRERDRDRKLHPRPVSPPC